MVIDIVLEIVIDRILREGRGRTAKFEQLCEQVNEVIQG